mgnify:CR=1 FL=1
MWMPWKFQAGPFSKGILKRQEDQSGLFAQKNAPKTAGRRHQDGSKAGACGNGWFRVERKNRRNLRSRRVSVSPAGDGQNRPFPRLSRENSGLAAGKRIAHMAFTASRPSLRWKASAKAGRPSGAAPTASSPSAAVPCWTPANSSPQVQKRKP